MGGGWSLVNGEAGVMGAGMGLHSALCSQLSSFIFHLSTFNLPQSSQSLSQGTQRKPQKISWVLSFFLPPSSKFFTFFFLFCFRSGYTHYALSSLLSTFILPQSSQSLSQGTQRKPKKISAALSFFFPLSSKFFNFFFLFCFRSGYTHYALSSLLSTFILPQSSQSLSQGTQRKPQKISAALSFFFPLSSFFQTFYFLLLPLSSI
ncbi:hypothetical protein P0M11_07275 [Kaistella sp. PBT33-4]|uniref:hypothetical protein n=1 Tax=Kaistella sp. PBT33-4 TaxID=3032000 RepID=UPI0023D7CD02|nr:hypothetical protein [Kaistella sp. PBT33-4]MDF0719801.1 hypothetical protein [Kaistella sp. PBT33-4]